MSNKTNNNQVVSQSLLYSSPIPMASELQKYEDTLPGAAERILSMAEKQSNHRIDSERIGLKHAVIQNYIGLILGFSAIPICIGSAVYFALQGHVYLSGILLGGTMVSVVSIFVIKSNDKK